MNASSKVITRRHFLNHLGVIGGSALLIDAMQAFGMQFASSATRPPVLNKLTNSKKVVILGAGLAGLCAAYELKKYGYQCTILEARPHGGGRCQTARRGTVLDEVTGLSNRCEFDEDQYYNHGPWRIPYHHRSTLYYTKALSIPLEIMINDNEQAFVYSDVGKGPLKNKAIRRMALAADMRGYESEILAKSIHQGQLDLPLRQEDMEVFVSYLVNHGALRGKDLDYLGTDGRGYDTPRGALLNAGKQSTPYAIQDLLDSRLWNSIQSVASYDQPKTMFQPIGGMDKLAHGFEAAVGDVITYDAEVASIRQNNSGVTVNYRNTKATSDHSLQADYCICTIPLTVLKNIAIDIPQPSKQAMNSASTVASCKLGMQMKRRFWEEDDAIYGGHSRVTLEGDTSNISYPSYDYQSQKGIVQGVYNFTGSAIRYSAMSREERVEYALKFGAAIHPQFRENYENSFGVAWHLVKYSLGAYIHWSERGMEKDYPLLCEPQGRILLAGDHMSHMPGWMAGAFESTWLQIETLHKMALAA